MVPDFPLGWPRCEGCRAAKNLGPAAVCIVGAGMAAVALVVLVVALV